MDENIYQENGYVDRDDYLTCLAEDFSIAIDTVYYLADILSDEEDFDLLISALEEAMYLSQENSCCDDKENVI